MFEPHNLVTLGGLNYPVLTCVRFQLCFRVKKKNDIIFTRKQDRENGRRLTQGNSVLKGLIGVFRRTFAIDKSYGEMRPQLSDCIEACSS